MKRVLSIFMFFVLALFLFNQLAFGAGVNPTKIAVVDVKKLETVSKKFQVIKAQIQKKVDQLEKELNDKKEDLQKTEAEFRKQSLMLSLDAQADQQKELKKKRLYLEYLYKDYTEQMQDAVRSTEQKLLMEVKGIVKKIAEKEGYILVLEKNLTPGLIVYDDVIDITDRVVEIYDSSK